MTSAVHAAHVLAMLDTGEWSLSRNNPDPSMTDEYQARTAWSVARQQAPFCDSKGMRLWSGPTPMAAFSAAHVALERPLLAVIPGTLMEAQLGFFFAVAAVAGEDDERGAQRQSASYAGLAALFKERAMTEFGKADPTVSADYRYVPFELCECEWEGYAEHGQSIYSVWFHSHSDFDLVAAGKLRELAVEAYTQVCGADARFIRAELYQKWSYNQRTPFKFDE